MPPVKPRYEHENVFGCLTRGYLKVLMNQVRIGTGQRTNAALCCYNMLSEDEIWVMSPHISHRKQHCNVRLCWPSHKPPRKHSKLSDKQQERSEQHEEILQVSV